MTTAAVQALCAACRCHMMKQTCRKDSRIGGCSLSSGEYILCLFTLACIKLPLNTSVSSPRTRRFLVFVCEGSRILGTKLLKLHESNRNTIRLPHTCSETSHSTGTGNRAYFDITARHCWIVVAPFRDIHHDISFCVFSALGLGAGIRPS